MNILFAAAEAAPLIKIGGLADVVGSLPKALRQLGHDVRVILPYYGAIDRSSLSTEVVLPQHRIFFDGRETSIDVHLTKLPNSDVPLYLIESDEYFEGRDVYVGGQTSDSLRRGIQRFVAFSAMTVAAVEQLPWQPEVIHAHDWHAALVPLLLKVRGLPIRSVLTIHNLHNQGAWNAAEVSAWLGWRGDEHPLIELRDAHHDMNILQVGIHSADTITTVSPTYAQEILTPEYGENLSADLAQHRPPLAGVLNGLDVQTFNPATDRALTKQYALKDVVGGKLANKTALQHEFGLQPLATAPLFVAVSRLSPQKGFDLLPPVISDIVEAGGQVAILGSGWPEIEGQLHRLADDFPRSVVVRLGFDSGLAQRLYAGGDFFLMPSRFEPCGLGQMIAMRYGTLPIVRETGGLRDTVTDADRSPDTSTGFVFTRFSANDFRLALHRAVQVYRRPATLHAMITRAMQQDFSWARSAQDYVNLYAAT